MNPGFSSPGASASMHAGVRAGVAERRKQGIHSGRLPKVRKRDEGRNPLLPQPNEAGARALGSVCRVCTAGEKGGELRAGLEQRHCRGLQRRLCMLEDDIF